MRHPEVRLYQHTFDWEDGRKPQVIRAPTLGFGTNDFWSVYEQLVKEDAEELLVPFVHAYNQARYEDARASLTALFRRAPDAGRLFGIHAWICDRVLAVRRNENDDYRLEEQERWDDLSWWKRPFSQEPALVIRCKWCGHLTRWVAPNGEWPPDTCRRCDAAHPVPDFGWDSMDGMAYSAGRGSWGPKSEPERLWNEYFDEYERRYSPEA